LVVDNGLLTECGDHRGRYSLRALLRNRQMEHRQHPRQRLLGPAKINVGGPDTLIDCVVVDWSEGGARLQFAHADRCPDRFTLITADGFSEYCEVAWRQDDTVGVRFPGFLAEDVHPAIRWAAAEAQRQAEADAEAERRAQPLLRRCAERIASAWRNAYGRPKLTD
jgi:hypothetical protein